LNETRLRIKAISLTLSGFSPDDNQSDDQSDSGSISLSGAPCRTAELASEESTDSDELQPRIYIRPDDVKRKFKIKVDKVPPLNDDGSIDKASGYQSISFDVDDDFEDSASTQATEQLILGLGL
jgi:hypothetical protein